MKKGIIIAILVAGGIIALGVCAFAIGNNKSDSKSNVSAGTQSISSTTLTNKSSNVSSETKSPVNVTNDTNTNSKEEINNSTSANNTNSTGRSNSANGETPIVKHETNKNPYGYTYATQAELDNISYNYYINNITIGKKSKLAYEISSIIINSNGIQLYSDITGTNLYTSSEKMKVWKLSSSEFKTTFGVSPASQGLSGNEFNVYSIGYVFIYQLPNKNILFSFENIAGTTLNNSNNIAPSNISNWYGNYTVEDKVGQLNGYNAYGTPSIDITGKNLILTANEYKYGNVTILNPNYYLLKVPARALLGTSYSGATSLNGSVYCIAVLSPKYHMTNLMYNYLPSYVGCTSGAWAANVAMPIILGSNNTVQVMNDNYQIFSTTKNK